jgi:hypothetical protein
MKRTLCTIAALAALTAFLGGCSQSPAPQPKEPGPSPAVTAVGALPLQADATLRLTGEDTGVSPKHPGVDEVDFAVPALVDCISVPVEFALSVDPHAQIIDQAGNDVPLARQAAYVINAREVWHVQGWHAEAHRAGGGLVLTRLEPALPSQLKAARERPAVVVHGLLIFNSNGVAPLRGVVTGLHNGRSHHLGGVSLDVPLRLDGVAGSASFDLVADGRTKILDAAGDVLPAARAASALDGLVGNPDSQSAATVCRLGSHRLAIVTLQLPSTSVSAGQ